MRGRKVSPPPGQQGTCEAEQALQPEGDKNPEERSSPTVVATRATTTASTSTARLTWPLVAPIALIRASSRVRWSHQNGEGVVDQEGRDETVR